MRPSLRYIAVLAIVIAALVSSTGNAGAGWWTPASVEYLRLFEANDGQEIGVCRDGVFFQLSPREPQERPLEPQGRNEPDFQTVSLSAAAYAPEAVPAPGEVPSLWRHVPDRNRVTAVEQVKIPFDRTRDTSGEFGEDMGFRYLGTFTLAWSRPLRPGHVVFLYSPPGSAGSGTAIFNSSGFKVEDCHVFASPDLGAITGPARAETRALVEVSASYSFERSNLTRRFVEDRFFTGMVTTPPLTSAVWEWGDGTSSDGVVDPAGDGGSARGRHRYAEPGTYDVRLRIESPNGSDRTESFSIKVT